MMKRTVLMVTVCLMSNMAMAEKISKDNHSGGAQKLQIENKYGFFSSSFDEKQNNLPRRYSGHSLALFQKTILSNNVIAKGKSEFETVSKYKERKKLP